MSAHLYTDAEDSASLTTQGSTSFHYSFSFLPREERKAINAVYAFCRRIDDIVDDTPHSTAAEIQRKRERLNFWRGEIEQVYASQMPVSRTSFGRSTPATPMRKALMQVVRRFKIPKQYFLALVDGCERDLTQTRYETFTELKEYCYSVASIVGLICIEIFGYRHEETKQYATNLGYALQLTNILRDVKADKDRGYIYLPQEDLRRFKLTDADILSETYDDRFVAMMEFQAQRARDYYHKARASLMPEERISMVAAEIMDAIYFRLLEKIQLSDYQVYEKRVKVNAVHKVIIALRMWLGSKLFVKRMR